MVVGEMADCQVEPLNYNYLFEKSSFIAVQRLEISSFLWRGVSCAFMTRVVLRQKDHLECIVDSRRRAPLQKRGGAGAGL